jgi:integrase
MAAARAAADSRDRLVMELLARTGMRAGELADLEADAVVRIGAGHWLRIPLGKLRNDRYVPLHPQLVELLATWTATNLDHIRRHKRLAADHRGPLSRYQIGRIVGRIGRNCGLRVHPHQLRHTLATQAKVGGIAFDASFGTPGQPWWAADLGFRRAACGLGARCRDTPVTCSDPLLLHLGCVSCNSVPLVSVR